METKSKSIEKVNKPEAQPSRNMATARGQGTVVPQIMGGALDVQRTAGNLAIQRLVHQSSGGPVPPLGTATHALHHTGNGKPLPSSLRSPMEGVLQHDLSTVRIHDDIRASNAAREMHAQAFTWGQDIYFGVGRYQPHMREGQRLLGHELAHVVQQSAGHTANSSHLLSSSAWDALEIEAEQAAAAISQSRALPHRLSSAVVGLQRFPDNTKPPSATPISEGSNIGAARAAGPPILWGIDTTTKSIYMSVTVPGRSLAEVAIYLYGSPDFVSRLRSTNGNLPEQLPPGQTLRPTGDRLTDNAFHSLNAALENGTALRTEGIPSEGQTQTIVYHFSAAGQSFDLTEGQFNALLQGLSVYLIRRATYLRDRVRDGRKVQQEHVEGTNSLIRGISDLVAGQSLPPEIIWDVPELGAEHIIDNLTGAKLTGDLIARQTRALQFVAQGVDNAFRTWHEYIERTISGAEKTAYALEITRDVSFGIAAGLAGAVAAPIVFTAAGTALAGAGITGTTATVLAGTAAIGTGAVAGGVTRGTLETIDATIGGQGSVGERFVSGFGKGAVAGGIGAAGALVAPGVSGAVSNRFFGTGSSTLTSFGARATVNVLTGVIIGAPSGMVDAALTNLPALASGRMSPKEYLSRIGWSAFIGGLIGGGLGLVHTTLTRTALPTQQEGTGLTPPEPARPPTQSAPETVGGTRTTESVWQPAEPTVNTATGEVTQLVRHSPTGEIFEVRFNTTTGNGSITRLSTGETIQVSGGTVQPRPAGVLPPRSTEATGIPESETSFSFEGGPLTFSGEGPLIRVPTPQMGTPFSVLEVGAGRTPTNLGIPESPVVSLTRTDIRAAEGIDLLYDARGPLPSQLEGAFDSVIINNPRGYVPDLAQVGKALHPGGKIIIQGNMPRNPNFKTILENESLTPKGFSREIDFAPRRDLPNPQDYPSPEAYNEAIRRNIVGGPFYRTDFSREVRPNIRIIFTKNQ